MLKRLRAFTLIELLIVITIIGILAVALVPRLTGGPARARDATRKADLQQIATALEFYNDDNGQYPSTPSSGCAGDLPLTPYLTSVPSDPQEGGCYSYTAIDSDADSVIDGYVIIADLETDTDTGNGIYETFTPSASASFSEQINGTSAPAECTSAAPCTDAVYVQGR